MDAANYRFVYFVRTAINWPVSTLAMLTHLRLLDTSLKVFCSLLPMDVSATMIAQATSEQSSAYSIAVAPDSSEQNKASCCFMMSVSESTLA
jgi:hypothetical protein